LIFQNYTSKDLGLNYGIEEKKIKMLQPGIYNKKFQLKTNRREPFVLFVGNFSMSKSECRYKGLRYFLEAAKELPDIKFLIVGGGSYLDKIKTQTPENIKFTGPLDQKSLIQLYNKALVFCSSSLTEGFGLAIQEAMTSGCAIVSTVDIGQKGILVPPKNSIKIKESIEYFIRNPEKAKKIGKINRKLSKKFSWEKYFDSFVRLYEELI
jgi:glycosyltransferase involved in cell wall biosynthesis